MSDYMPDSTQCLNLVIDLQHSLEDIGRSLALARDHFERIDHPRPVQPADSDHENAEITLILEDNSPLRTRVRRFVERYEALEAHFGGLATRATNGLLSLNVFTRLRDGSLVVATEYQDIQVGRPHETFSSPSPPRSEPSPVVDDDEEEDHTGEDEGEEQGSENDRDSTASRKRKSDPESPSNLAKKGSKKAKACGSFGTNYQMPEAVTSTSSGISYGETFTSVRSNGTHRSQVFTSTGHYHPAA
ncbi:hypothetical protein BDN72DRAFT_546260 [Pluteus cervinus]|uniref:Uncharacterized protein n=1 Tax=Pluteus cervinus TaxID=181527 RepID=A0ACD3A417_9AGAR|nr:hypothetical protein BDN72DRAFT_546260 [Pluteus cervinus]